MSKILIIEQNSFIRDALRQILEGRFPFLTVREAMRQENVRSGLENYKPDVLILGLKEYNGNNMEDLRRIREHYPASVIVLFLDYETDEYRKKAYLNGANHIISKDKWTGNEILALMKTILNTREGLNNTHIHKNLIDDELLNQPIERRRNDRKGQKREKEYLSRYPDRRQWN